MLIGTSDCILAVDGGGTRSRLALESSSANIRVEVGPTNITTDFDGAVAQLITGLQTLADKTKHPLEAFKQIPTYLGLAGYQAANDLERLTNALPLKRLRIEDDRRSAVRGALGTRDGALIHSGTGSFFAVQRNGQIRLAGGWGAILGDEGSAAWLGRKALGLVLDAEDGLRTKTSLTRTLVERFNTPSGILTFANAANPAEFGALAPLIVKHANDPAARELLQHAAAHFEKTLRLLGWQADCSVCLTGGLAPHLSPYLTPAVQNNLAEPAGSPLEGAIALARSFANEEQLAC